MVPEKETQLERGRVTEPVWLYQEEENLLAFREYR